MAAETDWFNLVAGLPPVLQGVAVLGFGGGLALIAGRNFLKRLNTEGPTPNELVVGDPTTFADLAPVKDLTLAVRRLMGEGDPLPVLPGKKPPISLQDLAGQVDLLAMQSMKGAVSLEASAKALTELADMLAAHLADLRAERARTEADEAVEERAQEIAEKLAQKMIASMKPPRRRVVRKRPDTPKT